MPTTPENTRLLLVFLKEPIPGNVKTRLAKDSDNETAALYFRSMVRVLIRQFRGLEDTQIRFCYAPDDAEEAIKFWILPQFEGNTTMTSDGLFQIEDEIPTSKTQFVDFQPQGDGDLGDRLERGFTKGFEDGFSKVAAIGSDCIEIGSRWINRAFGQMKESQHLSIGPTPDGGYYFIGLGRNESSIFKNIPWSAENTYEETVRAAKAANLTGITLPPLTDIDTLPDWNKALESPIGGKLRTALKIEEKNHATNQ